ncbi:Protein-lysine N-methyltransferase EFM2 [Trametes pubescens]|uniref:Protein-lysine N-methyltransferase EFM2 n=1 Tax=Trametes pubescens TaxID=154538 RepID=A0A1M2W1L1_TRAPU|nr:Protein-lysine N-methyltransferase EFM2 [Trametes pubescens]
MTLLSPPSARLPPIRSIHKHSAEVLECLVEYLRTIYNPPVRGTRRVDRKAKDKLDGDADGDGLTQLRADDYERGYAIRWLTSLVAQASLLQDTSEEHGPDDGAFDEKVDALVQHTASLLAVCAGSAAAGIVTRRFPLASPLLHSPIEVQLTDIPISVEEDAATVGAHTWGGACLLAELVMENPERYGLSDDAIARGLRILELGAGTGLVSLAVAKYLSARCCQTDVDPAGATVVATDYHPDVLENLSRNISLNAGQNLVSPSAHALDWSEFSQDAGGCPPCIAPFDQSFDIIFGADIIYEASHARWIRDTVATLLQRPSLAGDRDTVSSPRFHLLIPLRPTHALESRTVQDIFPHATRGVPAPATCVYESTWELCILEEEAFVCEAGDARPGGEVQYVHSVIGWAS